ncbi:MAG: tetratricopeptide repeat protein, partial [Aeoliella sp.]
LHAGQAAAQLEKWQESADWLNVVVTNHADYVGRGEVDFELGRALFNLGKSEEAMSLFQKVADRDTSPLGARARFMQGELLFAEKKYEEAVRSFFQVAYGYGEIESPPEYHPWQAESLFEAARCLEQLDRTTAAQKIYVELVERFPTQDKAKLAQERLKAL